MTVFISGGSGSGKSALAERICSSFGGEMLYIATMPVYSEEDLKKVARHHALRAGRGFETAEMPSKIGPIPPQSTVLFECLSTFTANRMFSGEQCPCWETALWAELSGLLSRPGHTVIVSAEIGGDGEYYTPEVDAYRRTLTALGRRICAQADLVIETVCGIPLIKKGTLPC